jgi:hypothetical protein
MTSMSARYLLIPKFVDGTGHTARAVETKIHRGIWVESQHYRRAPNDSILMDMDGYNKWVESQPAKAYG